MSPVDSSQAELAACNDLSSALNRILRRFSAMSGTVHVLDSNGLLHLAASGGLPPAMIEKLRTLPLGKNMPAMAVERRQPVMSRVFQSEAPNGIQSDAQPRGAVALPIFRGDAVIGALGITAEGEYRFNGPEMDELLEEARILAERFISATRASSR